jgi:hypothetical protein
MIVSRATTVLLMKPLLVGAQRQAVRPDSGQGSRRRQQRISISVFPQAESVPQVRGTGGSDAVPSGEAVSRRHVPEEDGGERRQVHGLSG